MLTFWKRWKRRKITAVPFPSSWRSFIVENAPVFLILEPREQEKLLRIVQVFVAEKFWEGCGGLEINDEIRVTIAAQAGLLLVGFENEFFDSVKTILVYPDAYIAPGKTITKAGVVHEGDSHRSGEAWHRGPVILSWADALAGGRHQSDGTNLVIHEFAHQLDMRNGGDANGIPLLTSQTEHQRWDQVMSREYDQLCHDCSHGRRVLLDCYGTTNRAEFFAVASECFFEQANAMSSWHPELYRAMRDFYRQNPAARPL